MARSRDALERVRRRRLQQLARLGVAERRRAAFIAVRHRPLHAVDRIAGDGVALAEVIEQRGQGRELAPDAGGRQLAGLQVLAPGDDMGAGDGAQLRGPAQPGEGRELAHVDFVGPAGFGIGDVGEPFELGRNVGEVAVLGRRQRPLSRAPRVSNRHQVLHHHPAPARVSDLTLVIRASGLR